jgi:hypothetical protein
MNEPKQTPSDFCEVVTQFKGEIIDKIAQISYWKMSGTELYEFSKFYFAMIYSNHLSAELRRKDDTIYKLKCIVVALFIVITMLIISNL